MRVVKKKEMGKGVAGLILAGYIKED